MVQIGRYRYLSYPSWSESGTLSYRDCLTKTKAYVAIHHSKALSLSIFRQPSTNIFINGTVSKKLHLKISALYEKLPYESAGFIQRMEFGMQRTWKEAGSHLKLA